MDTVSSKPIALSNQGTFYTGTTMTITSPDTGRITLTLKADTIKALRLLALLKDETQNDMAEALLIVGGLHSAVDSEWSAGKTKPTATAPVHQIPPMPKPAPTPAPMAPAPIPQATPAPPKPASLRDGWMPEVTEVSPYMDEEPPW